MSIFVEKSVLQLSSDVISLFACHSKLLYSAVAIQESQSKVYLFQEVFLRVASPCHSWLLILSETVE